MHIAEDALLRRIKAVVACLESPVSVATETAIQATEIAVGFALPSLLKRIYREVANGGIGPTEMLGLYGGHQPFEVPLSSMYTSFRNFRSMKFLYRGEIVNRWPPYLLPAFPWPCCIYSCLDCRQPGTPVFTYDANCEDQGRPHVPLPLSQHTTSFQEWLEMWLDGVDIWDDMFARMRPDLIYIRDHFYADDPSRYSVS